MTDKKTPGKPTSWADLMAEEEAKPNRFIASILTDVKELTEQVKSDRKQIYQLATLLGHTNKDVRIGAFKGFIKFLEETTELSKSDVKAAAKTMLPAGNASINTTQPRVPKQGSKKGDTKKESPEIEAIKAKFPNPSDRGKDSEYAKQIREARKKAKKAT